jgi:hypothetical protein
LTGGVLALDVSSFHHGHWFGEAPDELFQLRPNFASDHVNLVCGTASGAKQPHLNKVDGEGFLTSWIGKSGIVGAGNHSEVWCLETMAWFGHGDALPAQAELSSLLIAMPHCKVHL